MALKIVTGGTTGAADGTLVSSGNKLTFTALSPSYISAHLRCDDGYWSADQVFNVPAEVEISFDGGSTWYDSGDNPISAPEVEDVNYPVRLRQSVSSASTSGSLTTDGTYTAITVLGDVSGLGATAGDAQVALSWSAVANRTYYQVQRATDAGFTTGLTTLTNTLTSTSYTDTGLTNGTTYYYRVKALGTGRYSDSASWATTNATPTAVIFSDSFTSLDTTTNWIAITSGSATVAASGGKCVITKNATGNKALLVAKANALAASANWTVTALVDMSGIGASDDQHPVLALARPGSTPTSGDTFTDVYFPLRIELYKYSVDGHLYYRFKYLDTGGTANWFDFGTPAWSTSFDGATDGTGSWIKLLSDTGQYTYIIQGHATNGVRMIVKSADGATTYGTSAYVPWASIKGSGSFYIAFGAWQYSFTTAFTGTMNVDSVIVT